MSEKAISIVSAEWEALSGLPYLQVRLYLVLRWYMNVATRRVGDIRGISLQSLSEELYIEPAPGRSESGSPTKKAIRSALQQLEKHGLVSPCGNGEVLVFFLPKAGGGEARPNSKGHKRGTANRQAMGHGETTEYQWFSDENGHVMGHGEIGLKGHTSEVRVNPISVEPPAAAQPLTVERLLSTGPVLSLPLAPAQVAEWIRLHELQRGRRSRVLIRALQITDWIGQGVTPEELAEAYCLAVTDREVTKNPAPINLPFLDIFVQRVRGCRKVSRGGGDFSAYAPWWSSPGGVAAKAAELGVERRDGESDRTLRERVELALIHRDDERKPKRSRPAVAEGVLP